MSFRRVVLIPLSLLFLISLSTPSNAAPPFMPRTPAISPDGSDVVFAFQGDLWTVSIEGGRAVRLTANSAWDGFPVFSPDGKSIAFASERYGDKDLFTMPAEGGTPTRLTFASTGDAPATFSPDGSKIYFFSRRLAEFPMDKRLWVVPVAGGTPMPTSKLFASEADIMSDGTMVLGIGRYKFGRRHYRGTYQRDIYVQKAGGDPVAITRHPGFDTRPQVGGDGRIYWLSDADETMTRNIWSSMQDGSDLKQETFFENQDVRYFSVADNGTRMVLEAETSLYVMEPGTEPVKLDIDVADDLLENPIELIDKTSGADELELSNDGEEFAMIVDGDAIVVNKELGGRARVLLDGPSREEQIAFRPGEETELLVVSDRDGEPQIFKITPDEGNSLRDANTLNIEKMTDGDTRAYGPIWSPEGDRFLYTLGNGDLHVMKADGKDDKLLFPRWRQQWHPLDYTWSPDGKWVALSVEDEDYNTDIWVLPSDGSGTPVNITQHPNSDAGPVWSDDGRTLAWSSDRNNRQFDVYAVYLRKEDHERTREEWEIWEKTRDKKVEGEDEEEDESAPEVLIDFDDIYLRARRVTSLPGEEFAQAIHPKGDKYFFTTTIDGNNDLYSVNRFGSELTGVTSGGTRPGAIFLRDGTFNFLNSGQPATVAMDGGSIETTDFSARLTLDKRGRRLQAYDEGWRVMRDFFYDPNMHGVDWMAVKKKYEPWVKQVRHDDDFADIVNLMLGELNASHMGFYQPWANRATDSDGWLGLEFDPGYTGEGLKIASVLTGGPCDKVASKLEVGDLLLKVDGLDVSASQNLWRALEKRQDMPTELVVKRGRKQLTFEVTPVGWRQILNRISPNFEKETRKVVEEATDGKVGYVYIRGMSWAEVERFEMNLYAAANGKDALIIDVRNNGGGWTTDFLMNILTQPEHAFTVGRDGKPGYPQSERQIFYRWLKPIAVLCDESSYSNAEIFSHAIKTTGRGPVVGNTTGGNVISTGGWYTQLPDAWIRLPQRGWYVWGDKQNPERNGLNEEGNGAVPDYIIERTPADILNGRDPQLDKAIELMKAAGAEYEARPKRTPLD